jgi:hypothetical protein
MVALLARCAGVGLTRQRHHVRDFTFRCRRLSVDPPPPGWRQRVVLARVARMSFLRSASTRAEESPTRCDAPSAGEIIHKRTSSGLKVVYRLEGNAVLHANAIAVVAIHQNFLQHQRIPAAFNNKARSVRCAHRESTGQCVGEQVGVGDGRLVRVDTASEAGRDSRWRPAPFLSTHTGP